MVLLEGEQDFHEAFDTPVFVKKYLDNAKEYEKEFLELRGSRPIKAQELLSKWIIDQRFETDVLKDADVASFFLDQGILSGNENIIQYLMDHVPQRTLESLSLESQLAVLRFQDPLTYPNIQKLLKQIVQEPSGLNQAYHFLQFEHQRADLKFAIYCISKYSIMCAK